MLAVSLPLRAARAAVFAAVCVALSAAGHAFMTSEPLPLWTVGAGFGAVFAVAFAAAGRERSLGGIAALLALAQIGLHTLFSVGMAAAAAPAMTGHHGGATLLDRLLCGSRDSAGHIVLPQGWSAREIVAAAGLNPDAPNALPAPGSGHAAGHTIGPMLFDGGYGMLAAHALAALVTAWWLRRGEAALFGLLHRLHTTVAAPLRVVLAVLFGVPRTGYRPPAVRAFDRATPGPRPVVLRHAVVRRGPPAFATAC
ncbi:hypothetical protein [Yinghuangia seranimata]|uniref:hypothetical protein n=1 Tax=Yinghuangia seranimata TaxID=408067 RepID=UPI00248B3365|nr:hypothetical protein [Yinghuangia seranimata]MDI2131900.1 hypothetical protein [Yinghuangia seranimata]